MGDVVIALLPASAGAVYFFGFRALTIILISIVTAVAAEALCQYLMGREITIKDYSAVVTGLLLALNFPVSVPYWIPVIGSAFAIIIVKQLFGGLGQNFMNPALAARAFLVASWPAIMTRWTAPGTAVVDLVTTATPLAILKGNAPGPLPLLGDIFIGNIGGCLGETSAALLILGALYLLYKEIISWRIPATFIGTVALFTWIFGGDAYFTGKFLYHIFAGGLILGAFYMATDYSSSPITRKGQLIYGMGCGLITAVIRIYGGLPEGVTFSILIMNSAGPLIEKYTIPRVFGEVKKNA
jgi:electron transport complex protein RnfD